MSYQIEYQHIAWRVPAGRAGTGEDQFLYAVLNGSSNVISDSGARARRWDAMGIGSFNQVLQLACRFSGDCEGAGLRHYGTRYTAPERYIGKVRRALTQAHAFDAYVPSFSKYFRIRVTEEEIRQLVDKHPSTAPLIDRGMTSAQRTHNYDGPAWHEWSYPADADYLHEFFTLYHHIACPALVGAWRFAYVSGPNTR